MNGLLFYWIAWLSWVWITWIMEKGDQRLKWAVIILLAIIVSNDSFYLFDVSIHACLSLFFAVGFIELYRFPLRKQIYLCFTSLFSALGYTALSLFALYEPAWVIFSFDWICALLLLFTCTLLCKTFSQRLVFLFFVVAGGEILYGMILYRLQLYNEIGSAGYLDRIALVFLGLVLLSAVHRTVKLMERIVSRYKEERRSVI